MLSEFHIFDPPMTYILGRYDFVAATFLSFGESQMRFTRSSSEIALPWQEYF